MQTQVYLIPAFKFLSTMVFELGKLIRNVVLSLHKLHLSSGLKYRKKSLVICVET